jgi:hypothetical protein
VAIGEGANGGRRLGDAIPLQEKLMIVEPACYRFRKNFFNLKNIARIIGAIAAEIVTIQIMMPQDRNQCKDSKLEP